MASQVILKKSSVAARVPVAGDLVFGELALNYADGLLYYKKSDGTTIGSLGSGSTSTYTRTSFTATAAQTVFTVTYTVGYIQVYYKGILQPSAEYTATNGTSITLTTAAALNDLIEVIAYTTSTIGTIGPTTVTGIISGGGNQINNVIIGASTPLAGSFTALTTSSTVTLSGGTANGVAYLNGSNVLTSGSALTFDGTNLNVGIGGVGKVQIGTASSGTFQTGLYASNGVDTDFQVRFKTGVSEFGTSTATPLAFSINGSEQMRLTSTGLGIGTSSPAYKLDIASTTTNPTARVRSNGGAIGNYAELLLQSFNSYSGSGQAYVRGVSTAAGNSNTALIFGVNNSGFGAPYEAMCLDSSGNLGLGVTPSAWYYLYGAMQLGISSSLSGSTIGSAVWLSSNAYKNSSNADAYITTATASSYEQLLGVHSWKTAPSGTAGAAIAFTQAMTLDASGNLSVGPGPARGNISVSSNISTYPVTTSLHLGYSPADFYGSRIVNTNYPGESAAGLFKIQQGTTAAWRDDLIIDNNGNLGLGVTPSAWGGGYKAFQIQGAALWSGLNFVNFDQNSYFNGTSDVYISTPNFPASRYTQANGIHSWKTAPSGTAGAAIAFTQAMTLDSSGNLGLGVTPSAWYANAVALQVGTSTKSAFFAGAVDANLTHNVYNDTSNVSRYLASSLGAGNFNCYNGGYRWFTAPSGTAGAAIAFTQAMALDASGNLLVGPGPARGNIDVSSNIAGSVVTTSLHLGYSPSDFYGSRIVNTNYPGGTAAGLFKIQQGTTAAWRDDLIIDDAGNLGLGVTPSAWSPSIKALQLVNGSQIAFSGAYGALQANAYYDGGGTYRYIASGEQSTIYQQAGGGHSWKTAPSGTAGAAIAFTQAMTLDSSGNLGIGTSSPWSQLSVLTPSSGTTGYLGFKDSVLGGDIRFGKASGANNNAVSGTWTNNDYQFYTNGAEVMRLDTSGNVGIGTSSPAGRLHVVATTVSSDIISANTNSGVSSSNKFGFAIYESSAEVASFRYFRDGTGNAQLTGANTLLFNTNGAERARIDSSGNLLVGQTTAGAINSNSICINAGSEGSVVVNHINGTTAGTGYAFFTLNAGVIGSITQSGTTAVLYNVTSDQRLKENIVDAPEFGSVIDSLQVRSFDWKTDETHQRAGFIAQELVTVAPEAVHQPADTEEMMAVDYSKLVPMLVKEIQSLRKRLSALEVK